MGPLTLSLTRLHFYYFVIYKHLSIILSNADFFFTLQINKKLFCLYYIPLPACIIYSRLTSIYDTVWGCLVGKQSSCAKEIRRFYGKCLRIWCVLQNHATVAHIGKILSGQETAVMTNGCRVKRSEPGCGTAYIRGILTNKYRCL